MDGDDKRRSALLRQFGRLNKLQNTTEVYKPSRILGCALVVAVVLFASLTVSAENKPRKEIPLHHFELPCSNCHLIGQNNTELSNFGQITGNVNQLCTTPVCHDFDPVLNHPVGIEPKGAITVNMPLDSNSRITCLTCHDETGSSDGLDQTDSSRMRILHKPSGIQFCSKCHMKMDGTLVKQSHWQFSTRAHLGSINPQSSNGNNSIQKIGGIDVESRTCLSCHDKISAFMPSDFETPKQRKHRWSSMTDHPIAMSYANAAFRRPGHYQYPIFEPRIRLFDGSLGCGSCHSPYSQMRKNLVMRNVRGALCKKCHNK